MKKNYRLFFLISEYILFSSLESEVSSKNVLSLVFESNTTALIIAALSLCKVISLFSSICFKRVFVRITSVSFVFRKNKIMF